MIRRSAGSTGAATGSAATLHPCGSIRTRRNAYRE